MKNKFFSMVAVLFVLVASANCFGQDIVPIKGIGEKIYTIAVVPFAWSGGVLPQDVSTIVHDDLDHSGEFDPMAVTNMLATPHKGAEVNFRDWSMMKQDYLLVGSIAKDGDQFVTNFELFNVATQKSMGAATVKAEAYSLRKASHKISDFVYEKITGVKGVFSTKMAYTTTEILAPRKKRYRLYIADIDGYNPQKLIEKYEPMMSITWSPDGSKLAYSRFENRHPGIFMLDIATGRETRLTQFSGLNSAPAWSPDGQSIAMCLSKDGSPDVYIMNVNSHALTKITNNYAIDTEPSWFPDGRSIVFTSSRGGKPQIYKQALGSGDAERLTFEGIYNAGGKVSASGDKLVLVHQEDGGDFHIAVQDLNTHSLTKLTQDTVLDESASVSANGNMVLYATLSGGRGVLSTVSVKGRSVFRIPVTTSGEVKHPAWSPYLN